MSAAARQARHRQRERAGRIVLRVEADEIQLVEALVASELLPEADRDDRAAVEEATARLIELLIAVENG